MTVVITGWNTTIAQQFREIIPDWDFPIRGDATKEDFPVGHGRYLFAQGLLRSKSIIEQTDEEIEEGLDVNYRSIVRACDQIFEINPEARVCIIGSESGYRGSYDENYAQAKCQVHHYIQNKKLTKRHQQLVGISPAIIEDAGMTTRREDKAKLLMRKEQHPMKRFLRAREVAMMAKFLIYDQPYVSRTVVRMHGGC